MVRDGNQGQADYSRSSGADAEADPVISQYSSQSEGKPVRGRR